MLVCDKEPVLFHGYLVDTSLMSSSLEGGVEKLVHDFVGHVRIDEPSRHDQYVGIVVQARHMGDFRHPAQGGTDSLMLVQCHSDAFSAAADGDAGTAFSFFNGNGQRVRIVGLVTAVRCVGSELLIFPSFVFQPLLDVLFQLKSGMVGCKSNYFHQSIVFTWLYTFSAVKPSFSSNTL